MCENEDFYYVVDIKVNYRNFKFYKYYKIINKIYGKRVRFEIREVFFFYREFRGGKYIKENIDKCK